MIHTHFKELNCSFHHQLLGVRARSWCNKCASLCPRLFSVLLRKSNMHSFFCIHLSSPYRLLGRLLWYNWRAHSRTDLEQWFPTWGPQTIFCGPPRLKAHTHRMRSELFLNSRGQALHVFCADQAWFLVRTTWLTRRRKCFYFCWLIDGVNDEKNGFMT